MSEETTPRSRRTKIKLADFEKKVRLRKLKLKDFDRVVELQLACFPTMKPWTRPQFESMLKVFPRGQICVESEGRIVASSSSLVLKFEGYKDWHDWMLISDNGYIRNHYPQGDTLYGIEIMVDPDYRGMRLARRLY
jgi:ribosomal protein S18 acetylase RimI-like enzyme